MTTYCGWKNYATWKVNLEMLDGFNPTEYFSSKEEAEEGLPSFLKEMVMEHLSSEASETSQVHSFAMSFLEDVDWHEIADNLVSDYEDNFTENLGA